MNCFTKDSVKLVNIRPIIRKLEKNEKKTFVMRSFFAVLQGLNYAMGLDIRLIMYWSFCASELGSFIY